MTSFFFYENRDDVHIFRRPTVDGHPTKGYHPVCGRQVNFLDITNDAMIPGVSPKKETNRFWNRIIQKAEALIR